MSDVRIEIDPNTDGLFAHRFRSDVVAEIEALGLAVDGPDPPIEQRGGEASWPTIILLTLNLAATALRDADDIIEILGEWLRRLRRGETPKQTAKLYGPDAEVLAEIKQDD